MSSSLDIALTVTVGFGDERLVQIVRVESVIPVSTEEGTAADLVDLARAALDRLGDESLSTAGAQLEQLRVLFQEQHT